MRLIVLVLFCSMVGFAQKPTITGVVSDNSGDLPGANVLVKGTNIGVQTDIDGNYQIQAKAGDVLQFSFIGTETKSVVVGTGLIVNVKLEQLPPLNEIIPYVPMRKKNYPCSTVVKAEEIENRPDILYIIDGVPVKIEEFENLSPKKIESVTVLKDVGNISSCRSYSSIYVVLTKKYMKKEKLKFKPEIKNEMRR